MDDSIDKPAPAAGIDLGDLDQLNNIDTARMALRWSLERLHALEKDKAEAAERAKADQKALARSEEEIRAHKQTLALRTKEIQDREAYYSKMEELLSLRLSGKLDVEALVREQAETSRLQEFLAKKEVELENAYTAKRDSLELEYSRLIAEKKHEVEALRRAAEESLGQERLTLEKQHASRLAAVRESESRLKTRERELAERQAHFDEFYTAQRGQLDSDLRRYRQEVEDEVKFRVSGAEELLKAKHAAAEEAWAREKTLYESDLEEKRAELSHKLPYILELEKRLSESERMVAEAKPTLELEKEARRRQEDLLRGVEAELHARLGEREGAEAELRRRHEAELRDARQVWERERERLNAEIASREREQGSRHEGAFKALEAELTATRARHEEERISARQVWEKERQHLDEALAAREEEAAALRLELAQQNIEMSRSVHALRAEMETSRREFETELCRRHEAELRDARQAWEKERQHLDSALAAREQEAAALRAKLAQQHIEMSRSAHALRAEMETRQREFEAERLKQFQELEARHAGQLAELEAALRQKEQDMLEQARQRPVSVLDAQWRLAIETSLAARYQNERRALEAQYQKHLADLEDENRRREQVQGEDTERTLRESSFREGRLREALAEKEKVLESAAEEIRQEKAKSDEWLRGELDSELKRQETAWRRQLAEREAEAQKHIEELKGGVDQERQALEKKLQSDLESAREAWAKEKGALIKNLELDAWASEEEAAWRRQLVEREAEAKKQREALEARFEDQQKALETRLQEEMNSAREAWAREKKSLIENISDLQQGMGKTLEEREIFWKAQYQGSLAQFDEAYWSKDEEARGREAAALSEREKEARKYLDALEARLVKEREALAAEHQSALEAARESWVREKRALIESITALQEGLGKTMEDKEAFWENQYKGLLAQFDEAYWSKEEEVGRRESILRAESEKAMTKGAQLAARVKELEARVAEDEEKARQAAVIGAPLSVESGREYALGERVARLREEEAALEAAKRELHEQAEAFAEIVRQYKEKSEGESRE